MKITTVNIPSIYFGDIGIEDINMSKLGDIVVLAGKNGAGKSRILSKIKQATTQKPTPKQIIQARTNLTSSQRAFGILNGQIGGLNSGLKDYDIRKTGIEQQIDHQKTAIESHQRILNWGFITTNETSEKYSVIDYVPKQLNLSDCNAYPPTELKNQANKPTTVGINLHTSAFARIQSTHDRWFNATHPSLSVPTEEKESAVEDYSKLKEIIQLFLGTELSWNVDSDATLFDLPLGKTNMSDGQKILLQFCIALHCQWRQLDNLILFMDEPENHLHPSVAIELINKIAEFIPNGQVWISTHSIPLLAHFDTSALWYVEDGHISHAGKTPEKVLASLLGDSEQVAKLQDFISLPSQFAVSRHAFESMFQPVAVDTDKDDPQSLQIKEEIRQFLASEDHIKILDFGAGKGRTLSNIAENASDLPDNMHEWFNYTAFDEYPDDKDSCLRAIENVYPDPDNRYFNDINDLKSAHDKHSFDLIIICNVLHEIDPLKWLELFSTESDFAYLLHDKGSVLIVEDHKMPIGEMAHQKGFIVLDTVELQELFQITKGDTGFTCIDHRGDGRIKSHLVPKNDFINISADSRINALKALNRRAQSEVLKIRKAEKNYSNGKLHGFWVQQLSNSLLAISELTN